jgi:hypothetical protein
MLDVAVRVRQDADPGVDMTVFVPILRSWEKVITSAGQRRLVEGLGAR